METAEYQEDSYGRHIYLEGLDILFHIRRISNVSLRLSLNDHLIYGVETTSPALGIHCDWSNDLPSLWITPSSALCVTVVESSSQPDEEIVYQIEFLSTDLPQLGANVATQSIVRSASDDSGRFEVTLRLASMCAVACLEATKKVRQMMNGQVHPKSELPGPNGIALPASMDTRVFIPPSVEGDVMTVDEPAISTADQPNGYSPPVLPPPSILFDPTGQSGGSSLPVTSTPLPHIRQTGTLSALRRSVSLVPTIPDISIIPPSNQTSETDSSAATRRAHFITTPSHTPSISSIAAESNTGDVNTPVDPYGYGFQHPFAPMSASRRASVLIDHFARQIYVILLLRLPSLYFTRVAKLFKRFKEIETQTQTQTQLTHTTIPEPWDIESRAVIHGLDIWAGFVDNLIKEWKTVNVVAALMLSAILTLLQVSDAADNAVTRNASVISLIAALWSLSFGCVYTMRFGTMKSESKAHRWAEEAKKMKTSILWNVWVMLALPAVWLSWSVISFCVAILAFVWTTGSRDDKPSLSSNTAELGPRIAATSLFLLGFVYFGMVIRTFRVYSDRRA